MAARFSTSPELRRWLAAWLFFTVLGSIWALATPLMAVPDEPAHTVYAAAAVRGEVWEKTEGLTTRVTVPAGWAVAVDVPDCFSFEADVPAGCAPSLTGGVPGVAEVETTAGRYPPAYYFYSGLPTLVTDGAPAVYLMRVMTAALVGALLASGLCSLLSLSRRLLPVAGFALATTPMLFFFAGSVNPQGPEIAAAIALWASGAVLLGRLASDPDERATWSDPDLRRVIAATAVLTVIRPMSLVWLALIVVTLLVVFGPATVLPRLLRSRSVLSALPLLLVLAGSTLAWIVLRDALRQQDVRWFADLPVDEALLQSVAKANDEFTQMIGYFGWLDSPAPGWAYVVYPLALGGLAALALPWLTGVQRLTVAAVALGVLVLPVLLELTSYRVSAFAWQGRYTLPLAVGVPILLGVLPGSGRSADTLPATDAVRPRSAALFLAAMGSIHVVAFIGALNRNIHGINGFWGITPPGWRPPLPDWLLIAGFTAVVATGGWYAWRLARDEPTPPQDPPFVAPPAGGDPLASPGASTGGQWTTADR